MSNTSSLNVINIQIRAEDQRRIDSQTAANDPQYNNLAQENEANDSKYYLWHGDHEAIPMGLGPLLTDPATGAVDEAATIANVQRYVQAVAESLPQANVMRIPFNENNFHPDGSMDIRFEAFLEEAAAQGFQIIMGYFGGDAQGHGFDPESTADDVYNDLSGHIYDGVEGAWNGMLDWLDAHPSVSEALYGLELINEPAGYSKGASTARGGDVDRFVELYVEHVNSLGDLIDARIDTQILVGGWAYSAHFDVFDEVVIDGTSALDLIRQGIGDDLVWSSHFYGGWHGNRNGSTLEDYVDSFERVYSVLGDDNILVTEMNARGTAANNWAVAQFNHFVFSRAAEWFADNGIGISWFPGVQSGASGLVVITGDGTPEFRHPDSFAIANHLFSTDENPVDGSADEVIIADRIENRSIRNENLDEDTNGDGVPDSGNMNLDVEGFDVGIAFGYGGNDDITGHDQAWDFLYGGSGNDTLRGLAGNDFLFGQDGDDLVLGGADDDKLFGNSGNDTLEGGSGDNQLEGGDGSDLFRIETTGINVIVDFDVSQNDAVEIDGINYSFADLQALGTQTDADLQGRANDLIINHQNGAITLLLNVLEAPTVTVNGTMNDDVISTTTTDTNGNIIGFVDVDGDTISRFAEIVLAGDGNDVVRADWGDDEIFGGNGNDTLSGDRGADSIYGEGGNDDLNGGDDDDYLDGGAGDDKVAGGEGNDLILGGDGVDDLVGNEGNDTLFDGSGKDSLTGGEGNDTFVMHAGDGEQDRIKDFNILDDVIDLAAWGVTSLDQLQIEQRTNSSGYVVNEWIIEFGAESLRINAQGVPVDQQGDQNTAGTDPFTDAHFVFYAMNRIEGTEGDDKGTLRLNGTAGEDEIFGLEGNDDLRGAGGDDVLHDGVLEVPLDL